MDHDVNRALLVGYWYSPAVGAAARRMLGFARYLPEFGWRTSVLTATASSDPAEAGDAADVDADILRVPDVGRAAGEVFVDYEWPPEPPAGKSAGLRRITRLPRGWLFPDRFLLWRRRARRAAERAFRRSRPQVVLASFPPASAALLGGELARRWRIPLVLDVRDLWLGPGGHAPATPLHRALHERLERRIARQATALLAVSDPMAEHLSEKLHIARMRVFTVPNGFDALACPLSPPAAPPGGCVLSHVGAVIPRNRPDLFFSALATIGPDRLREWRCGGVRIRFVGNLSRATASRAELSGLIETTGLVPHERAWEEMRSATALLLLVGDYVGRWGHNAKLFEYLRAGRPIVCLEESAGSNDGRLLQALAPQRCVIAPLREPGAVLAAVSATLNLARQQGPLPLPPPEGLDAYDRRRICARTAEVLTTVSRATSQR